MAAPATSGQLRTNLQDMQIGDYIACRYTVGTSGTAGIFSELGISQAPEMVLTGSPTPDGTFYFIKVDTGLLIADRVVQHSISWNTLNAAGFIEGKKITLGQDVLIRSLSGGVTWMDTNENPTTTEPAVATQVGAWPNNEWDKYIVNSDLDGKIIAGDNNVWHWQDCTCYLKDTPNRVLRTSDWCIRRGKYSLIKTFDKDVTKTNSYDIIGFRPVLEYIDPSIPTIKRPTTMWY